MTQPDDSTVPERAPVPVYLRLHGQGEYCIGTIPWSTQPEDMADLLEHVARYMRDEEPS